MSGDTSTIGYTHPIVNAVADLETILDGCADARLWSLSVKELDDLLPRAHALLARITGTLVLPLIREADGCGAHREYDAASTADWVRYLLRIPARQAKQLIGLARTVDGDAAATGTALAAGRISLDHAQVIADSLAALPAQAEGWVTAAAEEHLLDAAADHDPKALHRIGRRIVEVIDPDHGDELLRRQLERADRHADTGQPDPRPYPRRMADALVELADRALRGGDLPTQGGEKPTLILTLDYTKLAAELGTGTLVLRDAGCTFPGCDLPPGWCDAHHLRHWANGGPTDLHNLILLCPRHHHTAHHQHWTIRIAGEGHPELTPHLPLEP